MGPPGGPGPYPGPRPMGGPMGPVGGPMGPGPQYGISTGEMHAMANVRKEEEGRVCLSQG